jgi:hypothetical protein
MGADEIIAAYRAAFETAHPGETAPSITRRPGGWWGLQYPGSAYVSPKRLRDVVEMTGRLKTMASRQAGRSALSTPADEGAGS